MPENNKEQNRHQVAQKLCQNIDQSHQGFQPSPRCTIEFKNWILHLRSKRKQKHESSSAFEGTKQQHAKIHKSETQTH